MIKKLESVTNRVMSSSVLHIKTPRVNLMAAAGLQVPPRMLILESFLLFENLLYTTAHNVTCY